tara:strand:- start:7 stop:414 length:408 start_codon:yes stop_codon:yes gene_type:complete
MYKISWLSDDRQGEMPMGEYISLEVAKRELPACQAELLAQCLDDTEDPIGADGLMTRAACLNGTWAIYDSICPSFRVASQMDKDLAFVKEGKVTVLDLSFDVASQMDKDLAFVKEIRTGGTHNTRRSETALPDGE